MFSIDNQSREPVYTQIVTQTKRFILSKSLQKGEQMPSIRSLSIDLSVNPNTIQKAYTELDRQGLIISVPGKGSFISDNAYDFLFLRKRNDTLAKIGELAKELCSIGIEKIVIIKEIEKSYGEEGRRDD